jgi:2-amino-4-hydroxy-6-hydroxymethyldihydropteridine diphosphokinase
VAGQGRKGMNSMEGTEVFLSLGTNRGNRISNLKNAVSMLRKKLTMETLSSIYETDPLYVTNQEKFLNCVVKGQTLASPLALLHILQAIEEEIGRERNHVKDKGPRIIDIDILLYGEQIILSDLLTIPHPGIYEREFVLRPLLEIAPKVKDPASGYLFSVFLNHLEKQGVLMYAKAEEII